MSRTENMIVVIQCAGGKQKDAGHMKDAGRRVLFVADPESAPQSESVIYKRPDDAASSGRSCRDMLEDYNRNRRADNPLDLFPAWELYTKPAYRELAEHFGIGNLYILSAGWGLVKADYLLPKYDITFSASVGKATSAGESGTAATATSPCYPQRLRSMSCSWVGRPTSRSSGARRSSSPANSPSVDELYFRFPDRPADRGGEPRVAPRAVRRGFPARAANCAPTTRRTGTAPRRS